MNNSKKGIKYKLDIKIDFLLVYYIYFSTTIRKYIAKQPIILVKVWLDTNTYKIINL